MVDIEFVEGVGVVVGRGRVAVVCICIYDEFHERLDGRTMAIGV